MLPAAPHLQFFTAETSSSDALAGGSRVRRKRAPAPPDASSGDDDADTPASTGAADDEPPLLPASASVPASVSVSDSLPDAAAREPWAADPPWFARKRRGKKCSHDGCSRQPFFGLPSDDISSRCALHRVDGMEDIVNKRCGMGNMMHGLCSSADAAIRADIS